MSITLLDQTKIINIKAWLTYLIEALIYLIESENYFKLSKITKSKETFRSLLSKVKIYIFLKVLSLRQRSFCSFMSIAIIIKRFKFIKQKTNRNYYSIYKYISVINQLLN